MTFLKNNKWLVVITLIIGAFLLYWFMFRKEVSGGKSTAFVCNNTVAEWDTKMAAKMAAMKADAYYIQAAQTAVSDGKDATVEDAFERFADYDLRVNGKQCNPNYPLNSKDQFGV